MTLLIMAAGLGSRYKGGIKQITPVGPNRELIIEYSVFDAVEAGFNKVIFILRKDIEEDFRANIGSKIEKALDCEVCYVVQDLNELPEGYVLPEGRTKPWGTGQAVLAASEIINEPFCVVNADDYYGKETFVKMFQYLAQHGSSENEYGLAGFILKNTLSDIGSVTRGICRVDDKNQLQSVEETYKIIKTNDGAAIEGGESIDDEAYVSMNMWGFTPDYLSWLRQDFVDFLQHMSDPFKDEYLLPKHIDEKLRLGQITVNVLETKDRWFGITYAADTEQVRNEFRKMVADGVYRSPLF